MVSTNTGNVARLELLSRDNFDTWSMQVEALLVKSDLWEFVNGSSKVPTEEGEAKVKWQKADRKARADLILSIHPSELKQVRGCNTARDVWQRLESIYSSKGPARKATLLKQLILQRLDEGMDVKNHISNFFDIVDKLESMQIPINGDLLTIMLLYSLPKSFENFRCAIECRDELPKADVLKTKILEEAEARKNASGNHVTAMTAQSRNYSNDTSKSQGNNYYNGTIKCFKCGRNGHKANVCKNKKNKFNKQQNNANENSVQSYAAFHACEKLPCEKSVNVHGDESTADLNVSTKHMWILDSGCTAHLCGDKNNFVSIGDSNNTKINLANQDSAEVRGKGVVKINVANKGCTRTIEFKDALYVPDLRTNLVSIAKITDKGHKVTFFKTGAHVYDESGNIIMVADRQHDLFVVRETADCASVQISNDDLLKWHFRLGHLNLADIKGLIRSNILPKMALSRADDVLNCVVCAKGKMVATPFAKRQNTCTEALKVVHSDVVGPFRTASLHKERYFVTFIDEFTRWCHIYFLREKSDVLEAFMTYHKLVENQLGKRIKFLQSDNGCEYLNNNFDKYLRDNGIGRRNTIPRTPQQNGIAERYNRTVMDMARCLLIQADLSDFLWPVAVAAANYIRNRCPCSGIDAVTPYEKWFRMKPVLDDLRVFGSKVMVLDKEPSNSKLAPKSIEGVFVGYSYNRKGFRVWLPDRRQLVDSRDVKFIEERCNTEKCPDRPDIQMLNNGDDQINTNNYVDIFLPTDHEEIEIQDMSNDEKRGAGRPRILRTGARGRPKKLFSGVNPSKADDNLQQNHGDDTVHTSGQNIPITENGPPNADEVFVDAQSDVFAGVAEINIQEAIRGPNAEEWYNALESEISSILKHDTWDIIKSPDCSNTVGCRFVLTNKCAADGTIERRKARLVAKGYSQQYGLNYHHTFAPVARLETLRLLLALSVRFKFILWQFDIVTAYLNGVLDEQVTMKVPDMLTFILERIITKTKEPILKTRAVKMLNDLENGGNACKLKKSLYGLKQAGRQWYIKLRSKLEAIGLKATINEPCLFHGKINGNAVLLLVYVDDLLVASGNLTTIMDVKQELLAEFEIKDIGKASYCIGIEIIQNDEFIALYQKGYIQSLLKTYGMENCHPVSTPGEPNMHSKIVDSKPYTNSLYRELIGALMYLSVASRPEISNVVVRLAQFVNSPLICHWQSAKRVLRYLAGTFEMGLVYKRSNKPMIGYVDSDWGGSAHDRRSFTGYVFTLSGAVVTWKSQKQKTVALSSTEAEYIALAEAAKEAIYLNSLLSEIGFSDLTNITIFTDNRGAEFLASNPATHGRSKHIDIKHHFVRDTLKSGFFELKHVPTQDMLADVMTKPLPRISHMKCLDGLGISTFL